MNHHELLDLASTWLPGKFLSEKVFAESVEGPGLMESVRESAVEQPGLGREGQERVTAETPVGPLQPTVRVQQWVGPDRPLVVYHHGSGENPLARGRLSFDSFHRVLVDRPVDANVAVVRAPFHDLDSREYLAAMTRLDRFTSMIGASVRTVEGLASEFDGRTVVSGVSLGGIVSLLHRSEFGSADAYVPMLAGARVGEMFVSSAYRHLTDKAALARPDALQRKLDFADAVDGTGDDLFPLLGRFDRIMEFGTQKGTYAGGRVRALDKGHVTAALAADALHDHVAARLDA